MNSFNNQQTTAAHLPCDWPSGSGATAGQDPSQARRRTSYKIFWLTAALNYQWHGSLSSTLITEKIQLNKSFSLCLIIWYLKAACSTWGWGGFGLSVGSSNPSFVLGQPFLHITSVANWITGPLCLNIIVMPTTGPKQPSSLEPSIRTRSYFLVPLCSQFSLKIHFFLAVSQGAF